VKRWLRLDAQWDDSDWVALLEPLSQLAWVKLLCYVKRDGRRGTAYALSPRAAAKKWGVPAQAVEDMIVRASEDGALVVEGGAWVVVKWSEYQEPDPTATDRKRKQRAKPDTVAESHTHVTPESRRDTVARDHRPPTTDRELPASAIADEGEPQPKEPTIGEVMGVVRTELHLGQNTDETKRSGSVAREFAAKGVKAQDVIDACRGARKLVNAGLVDGAKPGQEIGLRFLRRWHHGGRLLWDAAIDHERHGGRRTPPTKAKAHLAAVGDILGEHPETPRRTA